MIKIAIPAMYEQRVFNDLFLDMRTKKPEWFYEDTEACAVYGNPQFCIWDGGRIFRDYEFADLKEIIKTIDTYNIKYGLPIRYVFTNNQLKEEHYYDHFCNMLLKVANNGGNEIVIADDNFRNYIASNYNYKFISSTTKCLSKEEEALKELDKKEYSLVCLDYNLNHKYDFLNNLSKEQKNKTELLLNAICSPGCPYRKEHYRLNSIHNLQFGKRYTMEECNIANTENDLFAPYHITRKKIKEIYEPMGITTFKIEGRTWDRYRLLLTYSEYFVKPEYKNIFLYNNLSDLERFRNENIIH